MAGEEANVKKFACPACSASLSIRGLGQTSTLACEYCGAIVDVTSEDYKLLHEAQSLLKRPLIPLGSRGKLFDTLLEVIGFLVRSDGSGAYQWREYLLFNPYKGFRWLSESDGHWSFIETVPDGVSGITTSMGGHPGTIFRGNSYKRFLGGKAVVRQVIGECYWRVEIGETVDIVDYVRPPEILSIESHNTERVASIGTYIPADDVRKAFGLQQSFPRPRGVAPNQPNPFRERVRYVGFVALAFFCIVTFSQCVSSGMSRNDPVANATFEHDASTPGSRMYVTPRFTLQKKGNLEFVASAANLSNSWIALDLDLLRADGQEQASGNVEVSYYFGRDSDGSWSEGGKQSSVLFSEVPAGEYYFTMDVEASQSSQPVPFKVLVRYDVPYFGNFLATLFLILLYPIWLLYRNGVFEAKRWSQSDYAGDDE